MKKLFLIFLSLCLAFGLISCSSKIENAKADIRGEITSLTLNQSNKTISILVEGAIEKDTSHDKATIYVTDKARVIRSDTGKKLLPEELKVGMKVEVTFEGPVRESYPIQADAKQIRILDK